MSTYLKDLLRMCNEYMEMREANHIDPIECAAWAHRNRKLEPQVTDVIKLLARDIRRALREEHFTDEQGRRVRRNHVVIEDKDGKQHAIWKHIEQADSQYMHKSLNRRRKLLVGGCCQLKADQDSFNENYSDSEPIQLSFDFTNDLIEAELIKSAQKQGGGLEREKARKLPNIPQSVPISTTSASL